MNGAIEACNVTRIFGGQRVLSELSLCIKPGEVVALHGANGAGKTTLLSCLAGMLRPTSGTIRWLGTTDLRKISGPRPVGFVGHESFLYPELSVTENLVLAARMYGSDEPRACAQRWTERIWLTHAASRPVEQLSRGMRQRLAIARALIHDPPIVLLDEPFSGLDDESRDWLTDLLLRLRGQRCTICFTSHDDQQSVRLSDRKLCLEAGRIRADGSVVAELELAANSHKSLRSACTAATGEGASQ